MYIKKIKKKNAKKKPVTRRNTEARKVKRKAARSRKRTKKLNNIIELRGIYCFYCGEEMRHQDMTIEHLHAKHNGGGNEIHNLYLAHRWCNAEAGSKSVREKKALRSLLTEDSWNRL